MAQKVAVVTGSNKGIGFGIVQELCEKFDGIVYLTARDVQRGNDAVKELEKHGYHPQFHQLDVTDKQSIDNFRDYLKKNYDGIDILVNNAAISFQPNATEPLEVQAQVTIDVNYFGLARVCHALFPLLKPNARVVNLSSSVGHLSLISGADLRAKFNKPNLSEDELNALMRQFIEAVKNGTYKTDGWGIKPYTSYCVSKVGVSALTFIQQRDFDKDARPGISVNAVHPGYVKTDLTGHTGFWTVKQGSDAPVYLALLPPQDNKIKGCYVWKDRKVVDWASDEAPGLF